ncbi:MAG: gluconolaconase [Acidobacteria bacterium]|nr:MAG: gluconolaconase [Acidobacteriota bacterium]
MSKEQIVRVDPAAAIPGGEVSVECEGYDTSNLRECRATFDGAEARLVGAAPWRVLAIVPETLEEGGDVEVVLESRDGQRSDPARVVLGRKLAEDLHLVANPAFDPDDGSLYVTRSGSRGQRVPVSLMRIDTGGELSGVSGEITNPTGIAFDSLGQMYVTSRMDGTVYRVTPFHEVVPFARNLGVATGLAFDGAGRMYVGDRTGTIHRVNGRGEGEVWALLEPSVAAYHLAFGPDDYLYVTGPTVSSHESVQRIDRDGRTSVFFKGLGRPNGLAFDRDGNLYVAASYRGRRGIIRIAPDGQDARLAVAGMNVVGLAFSAAGDMVVATNEAVFSLPLGIKGALLK